LFEELEEKMGETMAHCGTAGTLSLLQMQRVIFDDVDTLENQLFMGDVESLLNGTTSTSSQGTDGGDTTSEGKEYIIPLSLCFLYTQHISSRNGHSKIDDHWHYNTRHFLYYIYYIY
jgi:hypothetical protein